MAKPFALHTGVSDVITLQAGTTSAVLDQAGEVTITAGTASGVVNIGASGATGEVNIGTDNVGNTVVIGNEASPFTRLFAETVTLEANGDFGSLRLEAVDDAVVLVRSDRTIAGPDEPVRIQAPGQDILLQQNGDMVLRNPTGNVRAVGALLQSGGLVNIGGSHNVTIGDDASPITLVQGVLVTMTANSSVGVARVEGVDDARVEIESTRTLAGQIPVSIEAPGQSINLQQDGSLTIANPAGNATMSAQQSFLTGTGNIFINGVQTSSQTQLGLSNVVTLTGALTSYATLSPTEVPGLNAASRLDIDPNAAGTTIHSLFMASPNPDGRMLIIQNVGASASVTLKNQSGTGTVGDRFFWAQDMVIPAGGGVVMTYDSTSPGFWFIRAIPATASTVRPLFDVTLDAGPFGFGTAGINENIPLALGQTTLIRYTVDSGTRQAGGLVNTSPGGNVEGLVVCWMNNNAVIANGLIFVGNAAGSTVNANRFFNAGGSNADGETGGCVWYIYQGVSGVNGRWRELTNTSVT